MSPCPRIPVAVGCFVPTFCFQGAETFTLDASLKNNQKTVASCGFCTVSPSPRIPVAVGCFVPTFCFRGAETFTLDASLKNNQKTLVHYSTGSWCIFRPAVTTVAS